MAAMNTKSPTIRRILREAAELSNSPASDYTAEPLESDLFEWHFTLRGPPNSAYSSGVYHGRIVLPPTYPLRPPSFRFMTPSGRFETNREICLSISGHHEETWQPAWGIRTAIVALRSFMETDARGQLGGLDTTDAVRQRLATESTSFKCSACGKTNAEIIEECERQAQEAASNAEEVQVPQELKMGWRDEIEAKAKEGKAKESGAGGDAETSELAEGFVETVPLAPTPAANAQTPTTNLETPHGTTRNLNTTPTPTTNTNITNATTAPAPQIANRPQPRRASDDGIPLWLDRTIVLLVVVLIAMVLKVLFAV